MITHVYQICFHSLFSFYAFTSKYIVYLLNKYTLMKRNRLRDYHESEKIVALKTV